MIFVTVLFFIAAAAFAQPQTPIFSEDKNPNFSSIYHVDSLSNTSRDADLILRMNRNAPFNCTKETCPASVIINNKTGAVNMVTPVKVNSLYVGDRQIIDSTGQWTGPSTGLIGPQGVKGDKGETGATGAKGDKGDVGATGAKGDKGDAGAAGAKGDKGDTGATGAKGDKGDTGATGAKGDKGDAGATGAKGDKGDAGATGAKGDKGDTGATGSKGDKGDAGATGAKGDKGDTGATGAKGDKGDTGATGSKGDKGDVGATGAKGDKGDTGATGSKGDKGDVGATGAKGDKGETGAKGESCVAGASIYPACLDSLINQNLFKMIYSESISQECQFSSVGFQKKFTSTCPTSHPNAIGGGCEMRNLVSDVNLTSSEALKTGKGWQCELITTDRDLCDAVTLRVWTTCSRMAIDYSDVQ